MALSKKKSRPIVIDDENYRWLISTRGKGLIALIAEKENANGSIIEVKIKSDINEMWVEFPHVNDLYLKVVKPKDVERIIRQALEMGWNPDESGKPNRYILDGQNLKKLVS